MSIRSTTTAAAGEGSVIAFELPVALPPDGEWPVEVEADGRTTSSVATVADGAVHLGNVPRGTRVRVTFLA